VKGRVNDARLHPLGDSRPQHRIPRAARDADPISLIDAALLGIAQRLRDCTPESDPVARLGGDKICGTSGGDQGAG